MSEGGSRRVDQALEEELSALLDGEVAEPRAGELRRLIAADPALRARYESLRRADAALGALPRPERASGLRAAFEARLREGSDERSFDSEPPAARPAPRIARTAPPRRTRWRRAAAAATAAAAAVLAAMWILRPVGPGAPVPAPEVAERRPPVRPETPPSVPSAPGGLLPPAEGAGPGPDTTLQIAEAPAPVEPSDPAPAPDVLGPALPVLELAERPPAPSAPPRPEPSEPLALAELAPAERPVPSPAPPASEPAERPAERVAQFDTSSDPAAESVGGADLPTEEAATPDEALLAESRPPEAPEPDPAAIEEPSDEDLAIALELSLLADLPVIEHLDLLQAAAILDDGEDEG